MIDIEGRPDSAAAGAGRAIGLGVHLARLDADARQGVAHRAEALTSVLRGLLGATADPVERLRMARHLASATPGLGLRPGDIQLQDVTDRGVAGHLANIDALAQAISAAAQPRHLAALNSPREAPQGRARYIGPAD